MISYYTQLTVISTFLCGQWDDHSVLWTEIIYIVSCGVLNFTHSSELRLTALTRNTFTCILNGYMQF